MATGGNRINFQVGFNVDQSGLNQVSTAFQKLRNFKLGDFKGTKQQLIEIKREAQLVENALNNAFNPKLKSINFKQFQSELAQNNITLDQIHSKFSQLGVTGQNAFNSMSTSLLTSNLQLRQTSSFLQNIGTTLMNTVKWTVASTAIRAFTSSISQAFTYVKSLDSSLNDIRIVTKDSADQMANFAVQANKAASQLGRSTLDYTKAALTFYQQGLDEQAVQARTEATLKAQNITGAGSQMADYLTAVWNGYKVANEEAQLYVDKLAAVADSSASNMSQIAIAMSKVSSAANILGVDVDSLAAQIATIVATTRQAPQSVGNALKTVYARINDISTGADDAEISLGNYSKNMLNVGISVLDANGRLRNTGDVIDEVGEKWDSLSREQQIFLARTMAGQRQYNKLITLFDNWSKYTDLVTVSMQSQGAVEQKNAIYLESLSAHTEKLGAAQQKLKSSMINSDSYKNMLDIATVGTNLFANFIQSIGGGGNALLMLGGIFTQVFSGIISKQINNTITNMQNVKYNAQIIQARIQALNAVLKVSGNDTTAARRLNEVRDIYFLMSNQQKIQLDNLIKIEAEEQIRLNTLRQEKDEIEKIRNKFSSSEGNQDEYIANVIQDLNILKTTIDQLSGKGFRKIFADDGSFNFILDNLKAIQTQVEDGAFPALQNLISALENIKNNNRATWSDEEIKKYIREIQAAYQELQQATQQGSAANYDRINNSLSQTVPRAQAAKAAVDQYNNATRQGIGVQNYVQLIGALGRVASSISGLINLFKIWNNENLSFGEKVLQTFTNVGFLLPMLVSSLTKVRAILLGIGTASLKDLAIEKLKTAQKRKQLAYDTLENANLALQNFLKTADLSLEEDEERYQELITAQYAAQVALKEAQLELDNAQLAIDKIRVKTIGPGIQKIFTNIGTGLSKIGTKIAGLFTGSTGWVAWGIAAVAAIGLIAVAIKRIPSELEKAKEEAERFNKESQDIYKTYTAISASVQSAANDFKQLTDAEKELNNLSSGTEEWATQLGVVNQQITELIQKYPLLKQYLQVNQNGQLSFAQGAQQALDSSLRQQKSAAAAGYVSAQRKAIEAENRVLQLEFNQKYEDINRQLIDQIKEQVAENKSVAQIAKEISSNVGGIWSGTIQEFNNNILPQLIADINNLDNSIITNNLKTDNLIAAFTKTSIDFSKFAGYSSLDENGQEAYQKAFANQIANLGQNDLGNQYFDDYSNSAVGYQDRRLNMDRVVQAFEKQLSDALGTAVKIMENDKGEFTYQFAGQTVTLTKQGIISGLAYFEKKGDIDKEIAGRINELLSSGIKGALSLAGGADNIDYTNLTEEDFKELIKNAGELQKITHESADKIINGYKQAQKKMKVSIDNFAKNLSPTVEKAFREIDKSKLTETSQKEIGNILQEAFLKGYDVDKISTIFDGLTEQQIKKFEDLTLGINFNEINADDFRKKLQAAGLATNVATKALQEYINAQKTAAEITHEKNQQDYKKAQEISKNVKEDGVVSPQQVKSLQEIGFAVRDFMDITLSGGGKLTSSLEEFQKALNEFSLQKFRDQIGLLQEKVSKFTQIDLTNITNPVNTEQGPFLPHLGGGSAPEGAARESYDLNENKAFQSYEAQQQRYQNQKKYVELLIQEGLLTDQKEIKTYRQLAEKKTIIELTGKQAEFLSELIKKYPQLTEEIEKQQGLIKQIERGIQLTEETVKRIFDEDVDQKKLEKLADYFNTRDVEGYADIFKEEKEAAEDLAEELLRFDSALEKVQKNYQDWKAALESENEVQIGLILPDLENAYSDLLGWDPDTLTDGFLQNKQALQLFNKVLIGTEEEAINAYEALEDLAMQELAIKAGIDLQQFNSDYAWLQGQINKKLEMQPIGATIDISDVKEKLLEIVNLTAKSITEAQDVFKSFGLKANLRQVKNPPIVSKITVPQWEQAIHTYGDPEQTQDGFRILATAQSLGDFPAYMTQEITTFEIVGDVTKGPTGSGKVNSSPTRTDYQNNKKSSGGGGKKNKGNKGKGKGKGSKAKTSNKDLGFETKEDTYDPYEQVTKQLGRQSELLEKLQDQQDKLTGKDRLKNLQQQNKVLKEQNKWLVERQKISRDKNNKGTTTNLRKQLRSKNMFGKNISFDSDGQITDEVATQNWAIGEYNKTIQKAEEDYKKIEDKYNDYITKTWNKHGKAWQEKHKDDKQRWDERLKQAEEDAKSSKDAAEELYKKRTDAIKEYLDRLKEDKQFYEEFLDNIEKIIENNLSQHKIKVDIRLQVGDFERQWLNFRDKFIENITDKDFTKKAISDLANLTSYLDSKQLSEALTSMQTSQNNIKILENRLKNVNKITDQQLDILGITREVWNKMDKVDRIAKLKAGIKFEADQVKEINTGIQNSLISMQEKADAIKETLLSTYDELSKNQQDRMEQLDRAKDVIQHGMKMSQMTFGEKSYQVMNKYYAELLRNDRRQLTNLKNYRNYWQKIYEEQVALGDKANKELMEKALDQMNSWAEKTRAKVEQLAEHSAKQLEIKMETTIDQVLADLTGGLGEQFRDAEWDKLKEYDDNFLDVAETKMGIEEIQRLYNEVGESIKGNSNQAKRFNEFQQKQINLLKNKQHLTQYDLDRAKAALEVEQARYELEQARDQKTQLRLRRDSQGNYTYQYVADEQALDKKADKLQDKIANLYKMDKDAYIKNLELIQNKGREYYEEMTKLEKEYAEAEAAGDQARLKRLAAQMEMTQKHYSQFLEGLTEDNQIIYKTYLPESWGESMGREFESIDDAFQQMAGSVPIFSSTLQTYVDSMIGEGGIINAFQSSLDKVKEYIAKDYANIADALKEQGTSIQDVSKGLKEQVDSEEKILDYYTSLIIASKQQIGNVTTLLDKANEFIQNLKDTTQLLDKLLENYRLLQGLENFDGKRIEGTKLTNIDMNDITAVKKAVDDLFNSLLNSLPQKDVSSYASGGYTGEWENEAGKIAFLHQKELVLNANDTSNILSAVQTIRDITSGMSIDNDLQALSNSQSALLGSLLSSTQLDQNVHIEANFPNVTQHTQIEQAFANLVNIASMHASKRNN